MLLTFPLYKKGGEKKGKSEEEKERGRERADSSFYGSLIFVWL